MNLRPCRTTSFPSVGDTACRALAWASLLLCALHAHDAVGAVVLVGSLVLAPAGYLLVMAIAAVSIGLAFASWMIGKVWRAAPNKGSAAPVRPVRGRAVRWLANGITVLALSASILMAGFECLLAAPYIAEPTGPAGDRVVVVERNVLLAGYGDVYLIPGGFGVGRRIAATAPTMVTAPWATGPTRSSGAGQSCTSPHTAPPPDPVVMYPAD